MKKAADAFSWVPPLAWDETRRGPNLVYRRPGRELVLSFWAVKEGLKPEKQAAAIETLMDTALKAIEKDSKNPNLQPSVPLTRVDENGLEFWVQSLVTRDGTVGISSAAVRGVVGVLLATMEAPTQPEHFPVFIEFLRSVKALAVAAVVILAAGLTVSAASNDTVAPVSSYRKYIWAAREAYDRRDFPQAQKLLKSYEDLGAPGDKILEASGCDPKLGVHVLSEALKTAQACLQSPGGGTRWPGDQSGAAQMAVVSALRLGDYASLAPYLECAPVDVTARESFCHTPFYPSAADFEKFVTALHARPDVLEKMEWREIRITWDSASHVEPSPGEFENQGFTAMDDGGHKWQLYSGSDHWHPCDMSGVPLLVLRQNKKGDIRISGFAASCL